MSRPSLLDAAPPTPAPLSLTLTADRTAVVAGEPILLRAVLRNESPAPAVLMFRTLRQEISMLVSRGSEELTADSELVAGDVRMTGSFSSLSYRTLAPLEQWQRRLLWTPRLGIAAGVYTARAGFSASLGPRRQPIALHTDPLLLTVRQHEGVDPAGTPFAHAVGPHVAPLSVRLELEVNTYFVSLDDPDLAARCAIEWADGPGVLSCQRFASIRPNGVVMDLTEAAVARLRLDLRVVRVSEFS
jgi:hypothetical protein